MTPGQPIATLVSSTNLSRGGRKRQPSTTPNWTRARSNQEPSRASGGLSEETRRGAKRNGRTNAERKPVFSGLSSTSRSRTSDHRFLTYAIPAMLSRRGFGLVSLSKLLATQLRFVAPWLSRYVCNPLPKWQRGRSSSSAFQEIIKFSSNAYYYHKGYPGTHKPNIGEGVGMSIGLMALMLFTTITTNQSMYRMGSSVWRIPAELSSASTDHCCAGCFSAGRTNRVDFRPFDAAL